MLMREIQMATTIVSGMMEQEMTELGKVVLATTNV
jgi:hypothetical protein